MIRLTSFRQRRTAALLYAQAEQSIASALDQRRPRRPRRGPRAAPAHP